MQLEVTKLVARGPLRVGLALTMLALLAWEFHSDGRLTADHPLSWFQLALIAASPLLPRISCALLLALGATAMLVPAIDPFSMTGALYALAVLSYDTGNRTAIALALALSVCQLTHMAGAHGTNDLDMVELPGFVIPYALAVTAGRALRWREALFEEREQRNEYRRRLEAANHNARVAQELHDRLTGELSLIARMAQNRMRHGGQAREGDWEAINEGAMTALAEVHRIIDRLDGKGEGGLPDERAQQEPPHLEALRAELTRQDARMAALGFAGHGTLKTRPSPRDTALAPDASDGPPMDTTLALIRELYANISRHGAPDGEYAVRVVIDDAGVTIRQTNAVASPAPADGSAGRRTRAGHGLRHFRREIENRRGTFETRRDDRMWTLMAWIPLR